MKVEKRDGRVHDFKFQKIENAVNKVYGSKMVNTPVPDKFINSLEELFNKIIEKSKSKGSDYAMPIEEIQDIIRDQLIKKNQIKAAEAFILYRDKRNRKREEKSWLTKEITKALKASDVQNQNANLDEASFGGRMGEASNIVTTDYALKNCVSKTVRDNHNSNRAYIHDRSAYAVGEHNCLSEPFDKMLKYGVNTRQTDVRSANSINTACQLIAVYFQLQSLQQFGGVSSTHIDWTLVPYLRKSFEKHYLIEWMKTQDEFYNIDFENEDCDTINKWVTDETVEFFLETELKDSDFVFGSTKLDKRLYQNAMYETRRELYQAIEGMYHNLNTLQSRSGNQLPFTSINYGTCTLPEGRMIIRSLIETSIKGVGKLGKTSIFPCGIFQYKKGINNRENTPNYDLKLLALKSTAKRLYPNYANCDWSNQTKQVNLDRKLKLEYIQSLSDNDYKKLIDILSNNIDIANKLDIIVQEDRQIIMNYNQRPTEIFSTMGCRTANGYDINFMDCYKKNIQTLLETGNLYQDTYLSGAQKDGRGNVCPSTVIMPTLAMEAVESIYSADIEGENTYFDKVQYAHNHKEEVISKFMEILDEVIHDVKDGLLERFQYICKQSPKSAKFMYENHTMEGYEEELGIFSAMRHGTLAVGQLGLAETLQILIGCDHTCDEGKELAHKIESLFETRCNEFKAKYKLNFGVYYTPAESLCYTAFKKWYNKYGDLENVTYFWKTDNEGNKIKEEKIYFTNSMHVPVWHQISAMEKIDIESQLTGYSNAGCITYVELSHEVVHNIKALEEIVDHAMEKDIPYFAVNVPSDTCLDCGYQGHIGDKCPKCGSTKIQRLARVTGYLTGHYPDAFNKGKVNEKEDRVNHVKIVNFK